MPSCIAVDRLSSPSINLSSIQHCEEPTIRETSHKCFLDANDSSLLLQLVHGDSVQHDLSAELSGHIIIDYIIVYTIKLVWWLQTHKDTLENLEVYPRFRRVTLKSDQSDSETSYDDPRNQIRRLDQRNLAMIHDSKVKVWLYGC